MLSEERNGTPTHEWSWRRGMAHTHTQECSWRRGMAHTHTHARMLLEKRNDAHTERNAHGGEEWHTHARMLSEERNGTPTHECSQRR